MMRMRPLLEFIYPMVAATSWAARLKAGLTRTREVLNTDVGELLLAAGDRRDAVQQRLETALIAADCGPRRNRVSDRQAPRTRARKERITSGLL